MNDFTMSIANSPIMWILSLIIVANVVFQSIVFYRLAKKHVNETQLLRQDQVKKAFKIGVIGTIGPAFAVFAIAIALISKIGGPVTLARIGIIGSAHFEMIAADIGSAGTAGTAAFAPEMLSAATWIMTLGGAGWLIAVFFSTKHIDSISTKIKKANPLTISYMSVFAPFVIFFSLGYREVMNKGLLMEEVSFAPLGALVAGSITVVLINKLIKNKPNLKWLKEWAMGFAVIAAMVVGTVLR